MTSDSLSAGTGSVPADDTGAEADEFDPLWYLQANADVRAAGLDPREHYLRQGRAEGRLPAPIRALELDLWLWNGHADTALPALEALWRGGPPRERAAAGWVLSRWYREKGDPAAARAAILTFHAVPQALRHPRHPGPWLMAVQLCLESGDGLTARQLLLDGVRRFGPAPDLMLAEVLCRRAGGADPCEINDFLAALYLPQGLVPAELTARTGCLADRLVVDPVRAGLLARPGHPLSARPGQLPVSVILPLQGGDLAAARVTLDSLTTQSWTALEILAVDCGAAPDLRAMLERQAAGDPRLRLIAAEPAAPVAVAFNTGFAAATGSFVALQRMGDWAHRQRIEVQVRQMVADPAIQATLAHGVPVDDDLNPVCWKPEESWILPLPSSLIFRRELRDSLGFADRVRAGAMTEYARRIEQAFGAGAVRPVMPEVPLLFIRPGRRPAEPPHSALSASRRAYLAAARDWHARCNGTAELHLDERPAQRPFPLPADLSLGDPEPPPGPVELLAASPLFDPRWYEASHPDVLRAGLDPVRHYLASGAAENRDPGPGFSSGGYRQAMGLGPDENPLLHYETRGRLWDAPALPSIPGALADRLGRCPARLVFAHSSGRTLFGAERSLLDVLGRLAAQGLAPVVVLPALHNPDYLRRLQAVSAAVEFVPQLWRHATRPPHPYTLDRIRALIRRHNARAIHVNTIVLDAPLAAARAEAVQSIVHVRELPAEDPALCRALGTDASSLRVALLAEADRFVAASQLVADWLGCPERTEIRPNAVDPALFDLPFAPGPALRVAIISSNIAKKGLADFLEVARRVAAERPAIRFLIFGPATLDLHLLQPFPPNVEFRGYAETPLAALVETDLVLSLSKFAESFGRTVMEAMAAGRPVVCYDRGAPPTLVTSGESGFVVPADDPELAALAVMALDAARGRLARFSAAARSRARALQAQALQP